MTKSVLEKIFYPGRICWGVFDVKRSSWVLDCFDSPLLLFTEQEAAAHARSSPDLEAREYVIPGKADSA